MRQRLQIGRAFAAAFAALVISAPAAEAVVMSAALSPLREAVAARPVAPAGPVCRDTGVGAPDVSVLDFLRSAQPDTVWI